MSEDVKNYAGIHDISEFRVTEVLREWGNLSNGCADSMWLGYNELYERTKIPIKN